MAAFWGRMDASVQILAAPLTACLLLVFPQPLPTFPLGLVSTRMPTCIDSVVVVKAIQIAREVRGTIQSASPVPWCPVIPSSTPLMIGHVHRLGVGLRGIDDGGMLGEA